ncbi:AAA family ATPase [Bacillus wiedmannii]|uniref:A0A061AG16 (Uncharacterized protein) n=1 Tax=Bacillus wiedmannii TaxID=1890302 RepID=A0A1C4FE23_9BACI|nr:DUF3696 domain-containing protein [Bacillus wiedmannii]SCC53741.1 A0A061AG16 (Uncharacterized protein) [Bacillus wiedmannii]
MKLKLRNFKGIENLEYEDFKPFTVLSGVNSGGKTSFIHFLLLIKQSIESNGNQAPLILNKTYSSLGNFKDIIYKKEISKKFGFQITFEKKDREKFKGKNLDFYFKRWMDVVLKNATIDVDFLYKSKKIYIERYELTFEFEQDYQPYWIRFERVWGCRYRMETNFGLFDRDNYRYANSLYGTRKRAKKNADDISELDNLINQITTYEGTVSFEKLFPVSIEFKNSDNYSETVVFSPYISILQRIFLNYFDKMSYIGPLRDEPRAFYLNTDDANLKIGNKGEHATYILARESLNTISYHELKADYQEGEERYVSKRENLEQAVNYWLCDVFKMAKEVKVKTYKDDKIYEIVITNNTNMKTPISSVGFGVSQILPIVVEGLSSKTGSTLILEQPEIHLHPRVQSLLFDFLYSLTLSGKSVVVETHSDHLINRLRRRVAEDLNNDMANHIGLIFFENREEVKHLILDLNTYGSFEYWPEGFFDQHDDDLRAIVKAQNKKRRMFREGKSKWGTL